eukprot:365412-Chlamydomonas_euryale.AAC.21
MELCGAAWACMELHMAAWGCMGLHGAAGCCVGLHGRPGSPGIGCECRWPRSSSCTGMHRHVQMRSRWIKARSEVIEKCMLCFVLSFSGLRAFLSFLHLAVVEVGYERVDPV